MGYRDIRSLENAGVPIGAEAGVGYYLIKGYNLPPVMFSQKEAAALLIGEKFMRKLTSGDTQLAYRQALDKVKSVLESSDQDRLDNLDDRITIFSQHDMTNNDPWLSECQQAVAESKLLTIHYRSYYKNEATERVLEPIGLYHSKNNWHVIAWCRLRDNYRDFRLDRIKELKPENERFRRRSHDSLDEILNEMHKDEKIYSVTLGFEKEVTRFLGDSKYYQGYISETHVGDKVLMEFLTPSLYSIGRWLIGLTGQAEIINPVELQSLVQKMSEKIANAYIPVRGLETRELPIPKELSTH